MKTEQDLITLSKSISVKDRLFAAASNSTPRKILNSLAFDPVMQVCLVALKNQNCTIKRTSIHKEIQKCAICTNFTNCQGCKKEKWVKNPLYQNGSSTT